MFWKKTFEDKITDILMRKDFEPMQDNMIIDAVKMFRDYGLQEEELLNNLKKIKEINEVVHHYGEGKTANTVEFIDDKNDNLRININIDSSIGISDPYSYHLEKCEQLTELSQGIVKCLARKEDSFGINYNDDILGSYITHNLSKQVSSFSSSAATYDSNDVKYNVLSNHIDLLMKIDGKDLLNNYLNNDKYNTFFHGSDYENLNNTLNNLKIVNNLDEINGEVYKVNDHLFINVKEFEDFNKAYCEYISDKIKDLSKDEMDFYKEQIKSLDGINDEHLKILDETRENYIKNDKILEDLKNNENRNEFDLD